MGRGYIFQVNSITFANKILLNEKIYSAISNDIMLLV